MAKDKNVSAAGGFPGDEPGKPGEPGNPGEPAAGEPGRPLDKPTGATGGNGSGSPTEPQEPTRKPRASQPVELAQLIQSEETAKRISQSLPKHMTPERWISVLLTVNSGSAELQKCDPRSILRAALQAAVLGLDLNKTMREAYLIPRSYEKAGKDGKPLRDERGRIIIFWEATFMPGYAGLRKLVMNGRDVLNVRSALVYESELSGMNGAFVYQFSPDLEFLHRPCVNPRERGNIALAYAVAKLKTGEHVIEVMTLSEIEKSGHHRSAIYLASRKPGGRESGPWVSDFEMMVRKTVLKRLCNQLPMSPEAQAAVDADNQLYVSGIETPGSSRSTQRQAIEQAKRGRGAQTLAERLGALGPDDDPDADLAEGDNPLDDSTSLGDTEAESGV